MARVTLNPILAWFLVCLVVVSGCLPDPVPTNAETFYKRDMILEVNGFKAIGHLTVPQAAEYEFEVEARGDLDLFVLSSCHRVIALEEAGGTIFNKKKVKLKYVPAPGIEDQACPVVLEGYEVEKGRHSWGWVQFQEKEAQLIGKVRCNGKESTFKGVSSCQSQTGTIQEISFEHPVLVDWEEGCSKPHVIDDKNFRITLSKEVCIYGFLRKGMKQESDQVHRLTTLGFEKIMIRKN
jgi:hypothetical protein